MAGGHDVHGQCVVAIQPELELSNSLQVISNALSTSTHADNITTSVVFFRGTTASLHAQLPLWLTSDPEICLWVSSSFGTCSTSALFVYSVNSNTACNVSVAAQSLALLSAATAGPATLAPVPLLSEHSHRVTASWDDQSCHHYSVRNASTEMGPLIHAINLTFNVCDTVSAHSIRVHIWSYNCCRSDLLWIMIL